MHEVHQMMEGIVGEKASSRPALLVGSGFPQASPRSAAARPVSVRKAEVSLADLSLAKNSEAAWPAESQSMTMSGQEPFKPNLQDFEMYVFKCLEKYCSVAKPFRSNCGSLDPVFRFYSDCADFKPKCSTTEKEKQRAMIRAIKKKKKSVTLAPLFFPTWSNCHKRDREISCRNVERTDKLLQGRKGKLCGEIKLVIFVQRPGLCRQCCRHGCSKIKITMVTDLLPATVL